MTGVSILNDTSRFHSGSAAVMDVIFRTIEQIGWSINASFFGNSFMFEQSAPELDHCVLERSDVLIINGEGSLHDDTPTACFLMETVNRYKDKKLVLLNCLWQNMSENSSAQLQHIDLVVAREPRSFATLNQLLPGKCYLCPDLSIKNVPPLAPMRPQGVLFGGFYWQQHARASAIPLERIALRNILSDNRISLTEEPWHVVVNRLRSADLLITGKHHEVLAACLARCPFLYCPIETFKIDALGEFTGTPLSPLDLSTCEQELVELMQRTIAESDSFLPFFDSVASASASFSLVNVLRSLV